MRDDRHSLRGSKNILADVLGKQRRPLLLGATQHTRQAKEERKYVHLVLTLGRKDPGGHTHAGDNHQADDNTPSARRKQDVSSKSQRDSATESTGLGGLTRSPFFQYLDWQFF